jgi:DNA gyrase inhibitor
MRPVFEKYHNDGTESGIWDFEMCVPVKKAEESA